MKATYSWIKEYLPSFRGDVQEMCDRFTMSGTEVEYYEARGDDFMIEFAVTSNRVDCLGILGLARELAAACNLEFVPPQVDMKESDSPAAAVCSVQIDDQQGCPRYTAMIIEDLKIGPSPDWLVQRLEAIGLRSINNVVDATNFALFETNQPFHAFDLDKIEEGKIIVRRATKGEKVVAINDREYELDESTTVICDPQGVIAIAGVMGGAASEVSEQTTTMLLETAFFAPSGVRKTSKKLALSSDSAFRFERGIDAAMTDAAARRCAQLIQQVAGGKIRSGIVDSDGRSAEQSQVIPFRHGQVKRITGIDVAWERCAEIFGKLGFVVTGTPKSGVNVKVPSFRHDVHREIDLVEEVIRIHGLEHLPLETDMRVLAVKEDRRLEVRALVKDAFVAAGFHETITTSFCSEEEARNCFFASTTPVTIENAMRKDENAMRQSLMPSLLRVRKTNQAHGNQDLQLMEATSVYLAHEGSVIPEHLALVGALSDRGYRQARGVVEGICAGLGIRSLNFTDLDDAGSHLLESSGSATIRSAAGQILGYLGQPKQAIVARYGLRETPFYLELRLDFLEAAANLTPKYQPLSRFPAVKRDLAVVLDEQISWGRVTKVIEALDLADLDALEFFDEYYGKQLPAGKKSLAFSLTYRSMARTLSGEEVDKSQGRAIKALEKELAAQIRS